MTVTDPISDMLTRIRNAQLGEHKTTVVPHSGLKTSIAKILLDEGFIRGYKIVSKKDTGFKSILITLKYTGKRRDRQPVIAGLKRVSRPGRREYTRKRDIPRVLSGMGIAILSTPKGVMTGRRARSLGVGGEVLCFVW